MPHFVTIAVIDVTNFEFHSIHHVYQKVSLMEWHAPPLSVLSNRRKCVDCFYLRDVST